MAWAVFQGVSVLTLLVVPGLDFCRHGRRVHVLHLGLAVLAVAPLYNVKWGQTSALATAMAWGAFAASPRRRPASAAALLAVATVLKLHLTLLALPLAVAGGRRFLGWLTAWLVALHLLVPALVLGLGHAGELWGDVADQIAAARPLLGNDLNSQFLPHVVHRWHVGLAHVVGFATPERSAALAAAARGLGLAGFAAAVIVGQRRLTRARCASWAAYAALTFCALPLVVETSWPHHFVSLPAAQAVQASRLLRSAAGPRQWIPLGLSVTMASFPCYAAVGGWHPFGGSGMLCIANLIVLSGLLRTLPPHREEPTCREDDAPCDPANR